MGYEYIERNLRDVREKIDAACRTMLAAVKYAEPAEIEYLYHELGVKAVGENRVQQMLEHMESIDCEGLEFHFIGTLQTNKVKYLVGKIDLFHSCDRYELATEISRVSVGRGVVSDVLVQINAGDEATKGGFPIEKAYEAYQTIKMMQGIRVKGFMAMLPHSEDEGLLASLADKMRAIYEAVRAEDGAIEYLSMGMSGDYRLCIEHGSNMIRVGSTIFGAREYKKA